MKPTPVEENEILLKKKEIDETKEEFVENFNKYSCVTPKTRLIIVGTITPPDGMNNGYFYTAPHNSVAVCVYYESNISCNVGSMPTFLISSIRCCA